MSTVSTTVNVHDCPPAVTAGTFQVRAVINVETNAGYVFGPFKSLEKAEQCALVLASRTNVLAVTVETL